LPHKKLIARLVAVAGLSEQDQARLASLPHAIKTFGNRDAVVRQGDRPVRCAVVMSGLLLRQRVVGERNQVSSFYVPGDMPDLHTLHLPIMNHDLSSVGRSKVAFVSHSHLRPMLTDSPGLTNALWRETLVHAAIYREWVENLGSRTALPRVAHLICELALRIEMVGLLVDDSFSLPCTQGDIAGACGLSTVHVNRTIQELRSRGLIEWRGHILYLLRRKELEMVADFHPDYLHELNVAALARSHSSGVCD
jgi:CRP-like cAMP-binding protein